MIRIGYVPALLLVLCLQACSVPRPEAPVVLGFEPNAYVDPGSGTLRVELDNALLLETFDPALSKTGRYYAFRITVASPHAGDFRFSWGPPEGMSGAYRLIPSVEGPCEAGDVEARLAAMRDLGRRHTGSAESPAAYTDAIGDAMLRGGTGVTWRTCRQTRDLPAQNEKGYFQQNHTLLISEAQLPGRLAVRLRLPSGVLGHAATATLVRSPLRMAAVGDSVMWGQALNENAKFGGLLRTHLQTLTQGDVAFESRAHSGARLGAEDACGGEELHGEIPRGNPSINCQLASLSQPERLDLLLVNGCINNVGASAIALGFKPNGLTLVGEDEIAEESTTYCREGMAELLNRARDLAPNAQIVVSGYFPLLSMGSIANCPTNLVAAGVTVTGGAAAGTAALLFQLPLIAMYPPHVVAALPIAAGVSQTGAALSLGVSEGATLAFLAGAESRSLFWVTQSDADLAAAVEQAAGSEQLQGLGRGSVRFARVSDLFAGREAYTLNPLLFGTDCVLNTTEDSTLREARVARCTARYDGMEESLQNRVGREMCVRAAAFHPNAAGNLAYFSRILEQLQPF